MNQLHKRKVSFRSKPVTKSQTNKPSPGALQATNKKTVSEKSEKIKTLMSDKETPGNKLQDNVKQKETSLENSTVTVLSTQSSEKVFKPVKKKSPATLQQPKMNIERERLTDVIQERAVQASLLCKSKQSKGNKVKQSAETEVTIQGTDSEIKDTAKGYSKTVSSEFALAMQEFLRSESESDGYISDRTDTKSEAGSKLISVTDEPLKEENESENTTEESIKIIEDTDKVQPDIKSEAVEVVEKSGTEIEALSDVDSCLATSVGTLSPTKMLDQDTEAKKDTDVTEKETDAAGNETIVTFITGKDQEGVRLQDDDLLNFEKLEAVTSFPSQDIEEVESGNHSNCCYGVVVPCTGHVEMFTHFLSQLSHVGSQRISTAVGCFVSKKSLDLQ